MERISKDMYYCNIAEAVSQRSTCLMKHWGAVIVKDDTIISTGFNGAPRHIDDCLSKGNCRLLNYRKKNNLPRGTGYEQCLSVHAEMNAIIFADKESLKGATLYLCGKEILDFEGNEYYVKNPAPCNQCKKMIINAGIEKVVVKTTPTNLCTFDTKNWNENDITGGY